MARIDTMDELTVVKQIPSVKAWQLALAVMGILASSVIVGIFFGGTRMIVPATLGSINISSLYLRRVPFPARAAFAAILSISAGLAAHVGPDTVYLPILTGATALAIVPFTTRYGSVAISSPLVPAVIGMQHNAVGMPGLTILIVAACAAMIGLLLPMTKLSLPHKKTARQPAWIHGLLLAGLTAAGTGVVLHLGWGHGFWLLIGICMVLLPVNGNAGQEAIVRAAGCIAGAILAMAICLVFMHPASLLAAAAVAYTAAMAFSVEENQPAFITCLTLGVIMITATGTALRPGAEQMALITLGAAIALCGTEFVLRRMKRG